MIRHSIVIVGGSMVGLTLAALLVKHDFDVTIVESQPYNFSEHTLSARVSAIHLTSKNIFSYLNVWEKLQENATPLQEMKIWDYTQSAQLHFDSRDIQMLQMGWIVDNANIMQVLFETLQQNARVTFLCPSKPINLVRNEKTITLTLDNHQAIEADLLIGADGAHSWVRDAMQIPQKTRDYYHKAIIAVIKSQYPHHYCAYQKFLKTGPVALLPLQDNYHTALVWSADHAESDLLMQKSMDAFSDELTESFDFKLGKLKAITERKQFPLVMRHAERYGVKNCALVGDAAHTIHPLAGLGVNLGLLDAAVLTQTLVDARRDNKPIYDERALQRYTRQRKSDNTDVIIAMRGLKECFEIDTPFFNVIRNSGVNVINNCGLVKNYLMRIAAGQCDELPAFLQQNQG